MHKNIAAPLPKPGEEAGLSKYLKMEYGKGLREAAREGKTWTVAKVLQETGTHIDSYWTHGDPAALGCAAGGGHVETVRYLLSVGATPWKNNSSSLPLYEALKNRQFETADILYEAMTNERPLTGDEMREVMTTAIVSQLDLSSWFDSKKKKEPEGWLKLGVLEVSNIGVKKEIGLKLTEIFNFETRERITVVEKLEGGRLSMVKENFDRAVNGDLFAAAAEKLVELGGSQDARDIVAGITPRRKKGFPGGMS